MRRLAETAVGRPRIWIALLLLLLAGGLTAWDRIPKEAEPDVQIPVLYVTLGLDGASPEDVERLMVRPLETELRGLAGVKEVRSTAFRGGGNVVVEFQAGVRPRDRLPDMRDRVDRARALFPADAKDPRITEVNLSLFPVLVVALSGDVEERLLLQAARRLRDRIQQIPDVLEARLEGAREETVEILADPAVLEAHGISVAAVAAAFAADNRLVAAGDLRTPTGRVGLEVPGLFGSLRDISQVPVAVAGDRVLSVTDLGEVRRTFRDRDRATRVGGSPALVIEVSKRQGASMIETVGAVRAVVEASRPLLPDGVRVSILQDRSEQIAAQLHELANNLALAVLLVLVGVLGSLGLRATLLVAVAVPGSFLAAILALWAGGLTLNIVVLFGLIFAAGNVVDGAIVVVEYADARMREGMDRRAAYRQAVADMGWPVAASTATVLAAFFPLFFWPGIVGEFMRYMPISQIATMLAALAMALLFVPALGGLLGGRPPAVPAVPGVPRGVFTRAYVALLSRALRAPARVLALACLLLAGGAMAYGKFGAGVQFFPEIEPERGIVVLRAVGPLSHAEMDALVGRAEAAVARIARETGGIAEIYARSGRSTRTGGDLPPDAVGTLAITFADWRVRPPAADLLARIRREIGEIPGASADVRAERPGPVPGKPVAVLLRHDDPARLAEAVARVRAYLEARPDLQGVQDSLPVPVPVLEAVIDRAEAARRGVGLADVGAAVRMAGGGLRATTWRPLDSDDEIDVIVRFPEAWRSLDQVLSLRAGSASGQVAVGDVARLALVPGAGEIARTDRSRSALVSADLVPGALADAEARALAAWLPGALPDGVLWTLKGEDAEQAEARTFLVGAFAAAVALIFLILLVQFDSVFRALLVLTGVGLAVLGVLLGLLVAQLPFGVVMGGLGMVALAGIVVSNNIALLDTYARLRRSEGLGVEAALLRTGAERFRPVLLTAFNNVLGLLPMSFGIGIDLLGREILVGAPSGQWWLDLSRAIVAGMAFSTVLTLILTPCALLVEERVRVRLRTLPDALAGLRRRRAGRPSGHA
jgi:multidrug efflux pump